MKLFLRQGKAERGGLAFYAGLSDLDSAFVALFRKLGGNWLQVLESNQISLRYERNEITVSLTCNAADNIKTSYLVNRSICHQ